jgi:CheY-like chemotaxis protein
MANILILDHYYSTALLYREALQELGHRTFVFSNGKQALYFALQERIDVIIVDERPTGLAPGELLEKLKRHQPGIRAVLCRWRNVYSPDDAELWDDIIVKGCDLSILQTTVQTLAANPGAPIPTVREEAEGRTPRYSAAGEAEGC